MPEATPGKASEARTSIDALVELLRNRGKSELNALAADLGADPKIVERWAKVLEDGGMAKISYEVGRMYLEPITIGKEEARSVQAKLAVRESTLQQSAAVQKVEIDRFAEQITSLSVEVANIENIYRQRMPEVQQMLAEINKAYATVEAGQKGAESIKAGVESTYGDINRKINDLSSKIDMLTAAGGERSVAGNIEKINELLKASNAAVAEVDELRKARERFFETLKKSVDSQVKELSRQLDQSANDIEAKLKASEQQIRDMARTVNERQGALKDFTGQINDFKRHAEGAKRALNRSRVEFSDRYQKLSESIYRNTKVVEANSKVLMDKIGALKTAFGDVAKLDDTIGGLRRDVNEINAQLAASKAELQDIADGLKALGTATSLSLEQRANIIEQLAEKDKSSKAKVSKIGKKIEEAGKRLGGQGKA